MKFWAAFTLHFYDDVFIAAFTTMIILLFFFCPYLHYCSFTNLTMFWVPLLCIFHCWVVENDCTWDFANNVSLVHTHIDIHIIYLQWFSVHTIYQVFFRKIDIFSYAMSMSIGTVLCYCYIVIHDHVFINKCLFFPCMFWKLFNLWCKSRSCSDVDAYAAMCGYMLYTLKLYLNTPQCLYMQKYPRH